MLLLVGLGEGFPLKGSGGSLERLDHIVANLVLRGVHDGLSGGPTPFHRTQRPTIARTGAGQQHWFDLDERQLQA